MNEKEAEKTFDAVQMMRDIRMHLSQEIRSMSFEEEQDFLKAELKTTAHSGDADLSIRGEE